jgi:hypothetical protein
VSLHRSNVTRYTYTDGDERFAVTCTRHSDLSTVKFVDGLKRPKKAVAQAVLEREGIVWSVSPRRPRTRCG